MRRAFRLPGARHRVERELDDEVRFHIEQRVQALEATGLSRAEAEAEARRKFGDADELKHYCVSLEVTHMRRAAWRERLDTVAQDLRFALRQFRKSPAFAAIATLTLALGIGAATAIFSVVNGVVLRPLPFALPQRIVQVWGTDSSGGEKHFADPTFDYLAAGNRSLSVLAEYTQYPLSITDSGDVVRVRAAAASKQFFDVLGVRPAVGRLFLPEEQQLHAPMTAVISYRLWTQQFGASPSAIGRTVRSGTAPVTIVGVLPAGQEFPAGVDLWFPREIWEKNTSYTAHNWSVIARVKDGVTVAQANRDVSTVLRRLRQEVGDATWTLDGEAVPLLHQMVGSVELLLVLILAASGVLLLIACANVANLLIARMAARETEMAVRLAIGAGRSRLAQQMLVETTLLSAVGCAGGLLIAVVGMRVLLALRPDVIPRVDELRPDWRVLAFAMAVSAGTAVALGIVAAWRGARGDLREALSQAQRSQSGGMASYRVRGSLVVLQLAMTVVLLVGAGLLARSFVRLRTIDPGFRTRGVVVADLAFDQGPGSDSERTARRAQYFDELTRIAPAIPGVTHIGISDAPPFSGGSSNGVFIILSSTAVQVTLQQMEQLWRDPARTGYANYRMASEGYFTTMGIPLVSGRVFDDHDRPGAPHVAVINAVLAKQRWPNESPIGKVIEFGNIDGDMTPMTIVGIVGDTREEDLAQDPEPTVYTSYRQRPGNGIDTYVVLSSATEGPAIRVARRAFTQVRSNVPMRFQTIEQIVGESVAKTRFMLVLIGVFGAVALILATLGVYSVISYLVAQRGREISIRVALGASAPQIVRLVLGQGVALCLVGVVVGGAAALGATRVLSALLYQVSTTDPLALGAVIAVLCVVALIATYIPARRAARLAPMDILRS